MKSLKVWYMYTANSFQQTLSHRFIALLLFLGKLLRIFLFIFFLTVIFTGTRSLVGFSSDQVIFFYLSFNLIDTSAQLMFREVYRFRSLILRGDLDLVLVKPIHPLLRVLLGGPDILDLFMFFLILIIIIWYGSTHFSLSLSSWLGYFLLVGSALLISAAFHIIVLCLGVTTTSVDHIILIYRDLTSLMRIPVDVYSEPFRFILTFIIPLAIMYTLPPKTLLGLTSSWVMISSPVLGMVLLFISMKLWNLSLKSYQSAGG